MTKNLAVLGSTGSIGTQTLQVAKELGLKVEAISGHTNINLIEKQAREFLPSIVSVRDEELAHILRERLADLDRDINVLHGIEGAVKIATLKTVDTVVASIVGIAGLIPTLEAVKCGKRIALANKEVLVTAGEIVMSEAKKHGADIYPVDSEHSAIFQCLIGAKTSVSKAILTASGGPFRGFNIDDLKNVTVEQALKHPSWNMGKKITIDSATLMNKGLEIIEAKWLFGLDNDQIDVIIHPESIIHSMVEYIDNTVIAQLGIPDMKLPIRFALTCPERHKNSCSKLNLSEISGLTFYKPDYNVFRCLSLAKEAIKVGGTMPTVLNAANESAVELFIENRINFLDIPNIIESEMSYHNVNLYPSIQDILKTDRSVKERVFRKINLKDNINLK